MEMYAIVDYRVRVSIFCKIDIAESSNIEKPSRLENLFFKEKLLIELKKGLGISTESYCAS